ncbi:MAG: DUF4012 domain-containing protein [Actinomycetota bacterium]
MASRSDEVPPSGGAEGPPAPTAERAGGGRRSRGRRRLWIVLAVSAGLGALGTLTAISAVSVRADLLDAKAALERGKRQLFAGDTEAARASFEHAHDRFSEAESWAGNPLLRAVGWLPIIGRTPDAVVGIAAAGTETSQAAIGIASAVADLPGGLAALAPSSGAIRVDRIEPLTAAVGRADVLIGQALQTVVDAPDTLLIGIGSARWEAEDRLRELNDTVHTAAQILSGLPEFLGQDGPKRYFFGAQNPAELRGTGGILGAFSILTIDAGRFEFSSFRPIQSLPILELGDVQAPNTDYARNYDQFRGGRRFWTSINLMPDFPSVAQAILNAYEAAEGQRLDGVITADPFALQALLETTGPSEIPGYDVTIDTNNVIDFTTNQAYSLFDSPETRKRVLGDAAKSVFERFVAKASPSFRDLRVLSTAAAAGHIQVFSGNPVMEAGLRASSVGGAIRPGGGDFLSVVVNSSAGSKVDYYQSRSISYSVQLEDDGIAHSTAVVSLSNEAPTSGQPPYVIGPYRPAEADGRVGPVLEDVRPGESVALMNVYCAPGCVPSAQPTLDGAPARAVARTDLTVPYVQSYFPIQSGESAEFAVSRGLVDAWQGNDSGGIYRLTFANQTTIRPTGLHVEIAPPEGMAISSTSPGMRVVEGKAVFDGTPGSRLEIEVRFRPPLVARLWRDLLRFLRQPAIRL